MNITVFRHSNKRTIWEVYNFNFKNINLINLFSWNVIIWEVISYYNNSIDFLNNSLLIKRIFFKEMY